MCCCKSLSLLCLVIEAGGMAGAGRHAAGAVAERLHPELHVRGRERERKRERGRVWHGLLKPQSPHPELYHETLPQDRTGAQEIKS